MSARTITDPLYERTPLYKETRAQVLNLLNETPRMINDLADQVGRCAPSVRDILFDLKHEGLVQRTRVRCNDGRRNGYEWQMCDGASRQPEPMVVLAEPSAGWDLSGVEYAPLCHCLRPLPILDDGDLRCWCCGRAPAETVA